MGYVTVCPGWSEGTKSGPEYGTREYEPRTYTLKVWHEDEPDDKATNERIQECMVRNAAIRMTCWVAFGSDPSEAPCSIMDHVVDCEDRYYWAGGYGPEPDIDWPEDEDSPEYEEAEAAYFEWYNERCAMFHDLVLHKAEDVVLNHYEAIVRVAVALCYRGTLSGVQVAEIVQQVEGTDRSMA